MKNCSRAETSAKVLMDSSKRRVVVETTTTRASVGNHAAQKIHSSNSKRLLSFLLILTCPPVRSNSSFSILACFFASLAARRSSLARCFSRSCSAMISIALFCRDDSFFFFASASFRIPFPNDLIVPSCVVHSFARRAPPLRQSVIRSIGAHFPRQHDHPRQHDYGPDPRSRVTPLAIDRARLARLDARDRYISFHSPRASSSSSSRRVVAHTRRTYRDVLFHLVRAHRHRPLHVREHGELFLAREPVAFERGVIDVDRHLKGWFLCVVGVGVCERACVRARSRYVVNRARGGFSLEC